MNYAARYTGIYVLYILALLISGAAQAALVIDTVYVGDAGNTGNTDAFGHGGVDYGYHIGTYEVTNAQYVSFLNAKAKSDPHGLYHSSMVTDLGGILRSGDDGSYVYQTKAGFSNRPLNYVSFVDALRFCNWLSNGQGDGDTETGTYRMSTDPLEIVRDPAAWAAGGVAIATDDEWYKAAYYDPTLDGDGGYWTYPTQSDTITTADANYRELSAVTSIAVGSYSHAPSYYGTYDQGGNMSEFTETIQGPGLYYRGDKGGNFMRSEAYLRSDGIVWSGNTGIKSWDVESTPVGFRLVSLNPIPELAVAPLFLGLSTLCWVGVWRRRPNPKC